MSDKQDKMDTYTYLSMANLVDVAGVVESPAGREGVPFVRSRTGVLTRSAAGVVPVLLGGTGVRVGLSGRIAIEVAGFGDMISPLDYILGRVLKENLY